MLTIIYAYRNRDLARVKRSLDSLDQQFKKNFEVLFIDYGSDSDLANEVKNLISEYGFVNYEYIFTRYQPWNKCKALNYAIKKIESEYCFNADVDIIFHPEFTSLLEEMFDSNRVLYFQIGFLSEQESLKQLKFNDYNVNFLTDRNATGMSLFPVKMIKNIQGFDEFFHFWGSEDTDIHNRLINKGCKIEYYNSKLLLLHQWHKNYRNRETKQLNLELQMSKTVEINYQHLKYNLENNVIRVNSESWGEVNCEAEFNELENFQNERILTNKLEIVDHFLFVELPQAERTILSIQFVEDPLQQSLKYKIKQFLGKKVQKYYTLKEINDKLLLHTISFYHTYPYSYKVSKDLKSVAFKIKK